MKTVGFAALVLFAVVAAGTGGLYAHDASRSDLIAEGITVAGVSLGGMTTGEAGAVLERRVLPGLERPLILRRRDRRS